MVFVLLLQMPTFTCLKKGRPRKGKKHLSFRLDKCNTFSFRLYFFLIFFLKLTFAAYSTHYKTIK